MSPVRDSGARADWQACTTLAFEVDHHAFIQVIAMLTVTCRFATQLA